MAWVMVKVTTLVADALIFDLEDAVTADAKLGAREMMRDAFVAGGYRADDKILCINGFDTPWAQAEAKSLSGLRVDAVLLPKVNTPKDIDDISEMIDLGMQIWAIMETGQGILNAAQIASY